MSQAQCTPPCWQTTEIWH